MPAAICTWNYCTCIRIAQSHCAHSHVLGYPRDTIGTFESYTVKSLLLSEFPSVVAFQATDEGCHWFISRARLHLVICATSLFALSTHPHVCNVPSFVVGPSCVLLHVGPASCSSSLQRCCNSTERVCAGPLAWKCAPNLFYLFLLLV
jgi:hypothetical protein